MELVGSTDPDYTIRGTIKDTSYINKDSAVDGTIDSINMPMGAVTIYMFYVIRLCILHYAIPKSVLN